MNYEEKLRLAKEALASGSYDKETIEYIFPELRESEDEKIRKALIRNFINQHSSNFPTVDGFSREQILAWLEKQEQKPAKFKIGDLVVKKDGDAFNNGSKFAQITKIDGKQYWFDCGTWLKAEDIKLWKPSDEEIEALNDVRHLNPALDSLYLKLKKS